MACSGVFTVASSEKQSLIDVMFLCDEWKSSKGGISTFNRELAINLAETTTSSLKVHCYVSRSDDQDKEEAKQRGVNLITAQTLPGSRDPLELLKLPPPELPNPHIVIGHGRKLGIPACHLERAIRCKWIQFVHVFCEDLGKFKETTIMGVTDTIAEHEEKHKMEIELCEAADAVVAVGSRLQQKYSRILSNVEIITPGIMKNFCNESIESGEHAGVFVSLRKNEELNALKSSKSRKTFNVFMFGRSDSEDRTLKGYDIVANAIGSLGEKFELTFVGSFPGKHREVEQWFLQETCIKREQITIRGYCTDHYKLKGMFHQSDLVALPSRTEGFGLVGLEAISAGVSVLVSGSSGLAEALQEVPGGNNVIVKSDDAAVEWERKISEVSSQSPEERQTNAKQLRENYRKVYPWRVECERFKELIGNVVKTANDGKVNIKAELDLWKPEEVQQPRASATSAASGSVSCPQTEDLHARKEGFFLSVIEKYFHDTKPKSIEEFNSWREFAREMRATIIGVSQGSLVITVKCESLQILEKLWTEYSSGRLGEMVQNCFVTEKILKEFNLTELKLKTTMDIEEYKARKVYFERVALRDALCSQPYFISSEGVEPHLERWKQKTEVEESEKTKDPVSNTLRDDAGKTIENELDSQMLLLQKIARSRGYEISDNEGSGNCMFHALSEQLSRVKRITMSSYELRQAIVQYLRKNPRQPDGTCRSNFVEGWKSWDNYLQHMEQDGSWGDHLILLATANLFKTCIRVVRSLSHHDDVFITSNYCTDDRNPLVLGHVPELHYVSLVRRDANPSE